MTWPVIGSDNWIKKTVNSCSLGRGVGLSDIKGMGALTTESSLAVLFSVSMLGGWLDQRTALYSVVKVYIVARDSYQFQSSDSCRVSMYLV